MERVEKQSKLKLGQRLLLFPLPLEGHVTPMLHLATLLYSKGFSITIIQTHYNSLNPTTFPHFTFLFIDDGLSSKAISSLPPFSLLSDLNTNCFEPFRDCLAQVLSSREEEEVIACLIADPMWKFSGVVAHSFDLPRITLRTGCMSAFVVYDSLPLLKEKGYFPLQETKLAEPVPELPPLRVKDLPSSEQQLDVLAALVQETKTSQGLICNSFEDLESAALAQAQRALTIPIFLIGPLHSHPPASSSWSTRAEDQSSISWLNTQAPNSVLYVSFGSIAAMSKADFLEIAWGLAHSMSPFLWVVRSGLVEENRSNDPLPEGFLENVKGRGHIVKWAPQKEVLAHPSVGGFWTHCGWNSTLESISQGVPMICLPFFADQAINARYVSDDWRIGLRLDEGRVKREDIVKAIRELMVEEEGEEMRNRVRILKQKAKECVMERGSSYKSLESLTNYLLSL